MFEFCEMLEEYAGWIGKAVVIFGFTWNPLHEKMLHNFYACFFLSLN